jgi:membrane protein required for colicin V production
MNMNLIDVVIAMVLILGFVRGSMRGFIVELASLVALVAGIYGAIHFSYYALDFLKDYVTWEEHYIQLAAFAITFLAIVLFILLIGRLLTKLAGLIALGILNRILGGLFGIVKFAFILSVIIMFLEGINSNIGFLEDEYIETSIFYEPVKSIAPMILPPLLEEYHGNKV